MEIGEKIKALRIGKKLTQSELSELCGISESSIRKYEKGERIPKINKIKQIAAALDVSIDKLVDIPKFERKQNYADLFSGNSSDVYIMDPAKQERLLNELHNYNARKRVYHMLTMYGHEVKLIGPKGIAVFNSKGIEINLSDDDIKALDNNIGFALRLKLEEIIHIKEGE